MLCYQETNRCADGLVRVGNKELDADIMYYSTPLPVCVTVIFRICMVCTMLGYVLTLMLLRFFFSWMNLPFNQKKKKENRKLHPSCRHAYMEKLPSTNSIAIQELRHVIIPGLYLAPQNHIFKPTLSYKAVIIESSLHHWIFQFVCNLEHLSYLF